MHWNSCQFSLPPTLMKRVCCQRSSLVTFVMELNTDLAQECEKLQGDPGEMMTVMGHLLPHTTRVARRQPKWLPDLTDINTGCCFTSTLQILHRNLSCGTP